MLFPKFVWYNPHIRSRVNVWGTRSHSLWDSGVILGEDEFLRRLFEQGVHQLEDFWGRRENGPRFVCEFTLFGRPVRVTSNEERVLEAVELARPQYSLTTATAHHPLTLHLVVRSGPVDPGPLPPNLIAHAQYSGFDDWLMIQLGGWGSCFMDLGQGKAVAVISPVLAQQPDVLCRALINTIFTNWMIRARFAMLHCTGLIKEDRVLLLLAPHNSGKSTTALRLVLAGYTLLSDSQIYISPDSDGLELLGFPVGKAKLRRDMMPLFPDLHPYLQTEQVRDETKYSLDLRRYNPVLVCETAVRPRHLDFCLLTRNGQPHSHLTPASYDEVMHAIMDNNSIFYDAAAPWHTNLQLIDKCIRQANCYHLTIGTDPAHIVATVGELVGSEQ